MTTDRTTASRGDATANNENSGGNHMSLNKSATRRLSLLAGSSVFAAGLTLLGGALAPTTAMAQATCVAAPVPAGNGTNAVTIAAGTYNPGISCTYVGTAATVTASGALTVSTTVGGDGVNLTATGTDAINWVSAAVTGSNNTNGPIIDAASVSGAINITTAAITGTAGITTSHGVQAVSTGGGAVTVSSSGTVNVNSFTTGAQQQSGIRAVSTGGNGAVSVTASGAVTGRVRGIQAQSSGTGALTITATNGVTTTNTAGVGVAAIDAQTGTGLLTININTGTGFISGQTASAIRTNAGGSAVINIAAGRTVQAAPTATQAIMNLTAVGTTTVNNSGTLVAASVSAPVIQASGANFVLANNGVLRGVADLGALTGNATINNNAAGTWSTNGTSTFAAGVNTINNAGIISANEIIVFAGLDALNNSGVIYMGTGTTESDGLAGDILRIEGAKFTGSGAGRVALDVNFSGEQTDCSTATAADCLDISGGSTAGSTLLTIRSAFGAAGGTSSNIVLVEGSTGAAHFSLDPNSDGYAVTAQGEIIKRQLFGYRLAYDPASHSHLLAATPTDEAFQVAAYAASAQEIWRSTAGGWFDRQADLRAAPGGLAPSSGLWARAQVGSGERSTRATATQALGGAVSDISYGQKSAHVVFGADLAQAASGDSVFVLGASAGYVRADETYDAPAAEVSYSGFTGGLYASWVGGRAFLDVNGVLNVLDMAADIPSLNLADNVDLVQTITSVGVRAEGGWRIAAAERYFLEPLVGVAYVTTRRDDLDGLDGAPVFGFAKDAVSLRAGAGLRIGAELGLLGQAASFSLTGRYWNEFEGESQTTLAGSSPTLMVDAFTGGFGEIAGSANLYGGDGAISGFLNLGSKFAEGYSSVDAAIGVRMRW